MHKKILLFAVPSLMMVAIAVSRSNGGAAAKPLRVVPSIDLPRYAGRWYEVARLPNNFQKQCAGEVTADYTLRPDGKIAVVNRCRKADGELDEAQGTARRAGSGKPDSMLEVCFAPSILSFLPLVWGDYQIIGVAEDYSYAMVGRKNRKDLWMLSRTPQLDAASYERLVAGAKEQGFNVSRLQKTRQAN